jgi:hypothetical protein
MAADMAAEGEGEKMNGKQVVTRQSKRIRCEIYTCKRMSGFSIGLKGFAPAYRNVCPECMDEIIRQAGVLLYGEGWTPEAGFAGIGATPAAPVERELPKTVDADMSAGSLNEPVDAASGKDDITDPLSEATTLEVPEEPAGDPLSDEPIDPTPGPEENAPAPADTENFYVCEDCGEKFKKPSEKMKYISHRNSCSKKRGAK